MIEDYAILLDDIIKMIEADYSYDPNKQNYNKTEHHPRHPLMARVVGRIKALDYYYRDSDNYNNRTFIPMRSGAPLHKFGGSVSDTYVQYARSQPIIRYLPEEEQLEMIKDTPDSIQEWTSKGDVVPDKLLRAALLRKPDLVNSFAWNTNLIPTMTAETMNIVLTIKPNFLRLFVSRMSEVSLETQLVYFVEESFHWNLLADPHPLITRLILDTRPDDEINLPNASISRVIANYKKATTAKEGLVMRLAGDTVVPYVPPTSTKSMKYHRRPLVYYLAIIMSRHRHLDYRERSTEYSGDQNATIVSILTDRLSYGAEPKYVRSGVDGFYEDVIREYTENTADTVSRYDVVALMRMIDWYRLG